MKSAFYSENNSKINVSYTLNPTDIFAKLVKADSSRYFSYLILSEIQNGLLQNLNKNNETKSAYSGIVRSLDRIENKSLESFQLLQCYASILNCYELLRGGNIYSYKSQLDSILQKLTEIDFPSNYSTKLNTIIPNMDYIESLETKMSDPVNYIPMYSSLLQSVAFFYIQSNIFSDKDQLVRAYEKLELELRKAYKLNPERYKTLLAMNVGNLAVTYSSNKDFKKAFSLSDESISLSNELPLTPARLHLVV